MGGKSAPSAPSPAQQGAANADAAIAQGLINRYNQVSPFGNVTYNQIGKKVIGEGKNARAVPMYEQVTTLSPSQQRQLDKTNALSESALGVGNQLFGNVADTVSQPFNPTGLAPLGGNASQDRQNTINDLYGIQTQRLDDRFGRDQAGIENRLANQGIQQGSEAYSAAMKDFGYGKNDAYNQAMGQAINQGNATYQTVNNANLANRQQGFQEQSYQRSLPINELSSLLGFNGGIQSPQFSSPPQTQIQAPNLNDTYATQMAGYSQGNPTLNGLMGAGGQIGSAYLKASMLSDARAKENIRRVGYLDNGLPVYSFSYIGSPQTQIGLMAQDVEKVIPEAVVEMNGLKHVNYLEAVR